MTRADLILQNSLLCDHLELLARQLRLYSHPNDSASLKIARAALRLARQAKRAKR